VTEKKREKEKQETWIIKTKKQLKNWLCFSILKTNISTKTVILFSSRFGDQITKIYKRLVMFN